MSRSAAIYGLSGLDITPDERAFFRDADPWGFIVFARNIEGPKQLSRLCLSLRDLVGRDAPILVDQEGGRVQRLKPPSWRAAPAAARFAALYDREPEAAIEAVRLNHRLLAHELLDVGLNVDCAPVLDLRIEGADAIIGDRAFGETPEQIAHLARAAMEGLMAGGVAPIIKHMPGHGRADADSHLDLPRVPTEHGELSETDFAPFKALNDAPMAMTAHVVYADFDEEYPATISRTVMQDVIRGEIGFDGLVMTDDLSMKALTGTLRERGERSLAAGCDLLLHCNGEMKEMIEVAHAAVRLSGKALERAEAADPAGLSADGFDFDEGAARLDAMLDGVTA